MNETTRKKKWSGLPKMDSPEEIRRCLSCKWPKCVNCLKEEKEHGRKGRREKG